MAKTYEEWKQGQAGDTSQQAYVKYLVDIASMGKVAPGYAQLPKLNPWEKAQEFVQVQKKKFNPFIDAIMTRINEEYQKRLARMKEAPVQTALAPIAEKFLGRTEKTAEVASEPKIGASGLMQNQKPMVEPMKGFERGMYSTQGSDMRPDFNRIPETSEPGPLPATVKIEPEKVTQDDVNASIERLKAGGLSYDKLDDIKAGGSFFTTVRDTLRKIASFGQTYNTGGEYSHRRFWQNTGPIYLPGVYKEDVTNGYLDEIIRHEIAHRYWLEDVDRNTRRQFARDMAESVSRAKDILTNAGIDDWKKVFAYVDPRSGYIGFAFEPTSADESQRLMDFISSLTPDQKSDLAANYFYQRTREGHNPEKFPTVKRFLYDISADDTDEAYSEMLSYGPQALAILAPNYIKYYSGLYDGMQQMRDDYVMNTARIGPAK